MIGEIRVVFFFLILENVGEKVVYDPKIKELILVFWGELKSNPFYQLMAAIFLFGIGLIVDIVMALKKRTVLSDNFFKVVVFDFPKCVMYVLLFPFVMTAITIYFGIKMLWKMGRGFWIFLIKRVLRPLLEFLFDKIICPLFKFIWRKIIDPIISFVWKFIFKPVLRFLKFCWDKFVQPAIAFIWKGVKFVHNKSNHLITRFYKNVLSPVLDFIFKCISKCLKIVWKAICFFFRCLLEVLLFVYRLLRPIFLLVWNFVIFPVWKFILVPVSAPIWRLFVFLWDAIVAPLAQLFLKAFDGISTFIASWFG